MNIFSEGFKFTNYGTYVFNKIKFPRVHVNGASCPKWMLFTWQDIFFYFCKLKQGILIYVYKRKHCYDVFSKGSSFLNIVALLKKKNKICRNGSSFTETYNLLQLSFFSFFYRSGPSVLFLHTYIHIHIHIHIHIYIYIISVLHYHDN